MPILGQVTVRFRAAATSICRHYTVPRYNAQTELPDHIKLKSVTDSLSDRGFHRSYKPYSPPENVSERVAQLCKSLGLSLDAKLTDVPVKFELLKSCQQAFDDHLVPNSILHEIRTVQDVIGFYSTPIETTLPMDRIANIPDLPQNLYIQQDYVRFSPETSGIFNGRTAFPKSSTLVSGIKTRRKYKGFEAKRSWY